MTPIVKKIISVALIVLAILAIYLGSYLPLTKSRRFIGALRELPSVRSVEGFMTAFDRPLTYASPVGQEEAVKFLSHDVLSIISQETQAELVRRALVAYVEPYLFQNNVRHLLVGGQMYQALWRYHGEEEDFGRAEEYYLKAFAIGPKLPPVLYNLLALYVERNDVMKAVEFAGLIASYWPDDARVQRLLTPLP